MKTYHDVIEEQVNIVYSVASKARAKGLDPVDSVEIPLAKNMAERVEGLITAVAPQIKNVGIVERIYELEKTYSKLDWRVAFIIAREVAEEKFCKFKDKIEAIEIGIRIGIAYVTNGVVSSPLEGFTNLKLKKTRNGEDYFAIYFSGPIRSAGGTGASVSVLIADYVRKYLGYKEYDPSEIELKRYSTEILDYHEKVTNLQYMPSEEEVLFMLKNIPLQIDGEPSEKWDVSNYKDIDRIETNKLRSGFCLVVAEGLTQKAPKLWAQIMKWGKEMDMDHWNFLKDFLDLQKKIKAREKKNDDKKDEKIKPDYVYISDIVAGRPVLGHPLRNGAFRLRYGRARNTGLSGTAINPATMAVLDDYIAIGTQLKWERPSKGTTINSCDSIEGPIVKLTNGDVLYLDNYIEAKRYVKDIEEIIYLGDALIPYGDFLNRGHLLVPCGYCEEWWLQELKKESKSSEDFKNKTQLNEEIYNNLLKNFNYKIDFEEARIISEKLNIPLHPKFTFHWKSIDKFMLINLLKWMEKGSVKDDKIILPFSYDLKKDVEEQDSKRILELLGVPHKVVGGEYITVENDNARSLIYCLNYLDFKINKEDVLDLINDNLKIKIKDKNGTFIGARMGRPEKAKMRKLTGSPHVLFPVGAEGGKLRSFNTSLDRGTVKAQFPIFKCEICDLKSIYSYCNKCKNRTKKFYLKNGIYTDDKTATPYETLNLDIKEYFDHALSLLKLRDYPDLIKGVRGTSNEDHTPENLVKGILRATYGVYVNKDGTIRYDMTELPITAFKPIEIGTSIGKLKELGYDKDMQGNLLIDEEQILELKPQDIILPSCEGSDQEGADEIFYRVGNFIDDLLEKFYGQSKFYNFKNKNDLVGHLFVALAPHISAGTVCRLIGFSKTQAFYGHPLIHCAVRRDCFSYNTYLPIFDGKIWKNVKIGEFVEELNPDTIVDSYGTKSKKVNSLWTLGYKNNKLTRVKINEFTKHEKSKLLKFNTEDGREITVTKNHKFVILNEGKLIKKKAFELKVGDFLSIPSKVDLNEKDINFIYLEKHFSNNPNVTVRGISIFVRELITKVGGLSYVRKVMGLHRSALNNFLSRNSFPLPFLLLLLALSKTSLDYAPEQRRISIKRDNVELPYKIPLNDDVLYLVGLYVAEGFCRKKAEKKSFYQVSIACTEKEIRDKVNFVMKKYFNLTPTENHEDHLTFSSRILYEFFVNILKTGFNAHNKRIPPMFFNLPKKKLASFLSGYFDGDGSVSKGELRVSCDSVSEGLLTDLEFALRRFGIFVKRYTYCKKPGKIVSDFYKKKNREIPSFKITKLLILSDYCNNFYKNINFSLTRKKEILSYNVKNIKPVGMKIAKSDNFVLPKIKSIEKLDEDFSYCLNVENNIVVANGIATGQCDGDEVAVILLMDALLNFSRKYLPVHRGARQDTPLVITPILTPSEVDDMVFSLDIAKEYPLEFYEACEKYTYPWDFKIETVKDRLGKENETSNYFFTHETSNINNGVTYSSYKRLPTMQEKVFGQMELARKIRAVDEDDVARLVVERHFIRDIRGNLRKFSQQEFRCSNCNSKYRRPPLIGNCLKCGGKIIFTISEGSIIKYLEPSLSLAEKFNLPPYLQQSLDLTKMMIESVFGKDKERQEGLGKWF